MEMQRLSETSAARELRAADAQAPVNPSILGRRQERVNFHDNRNQALDNPARAANTLENYATLSIKIVRGRGLRAADTKLMGNTSDPYAQVFINDCVKGKTPYQSNTLTPEWHWEKQFGLFNAGSILQIQVKDHDLGGESHDDFLGFVEFPVADLPVSQPVSGWFLLTDPEKLVGRAPERLERVAWTVDSTSMEETSGAIYLELRLDVISGDAQDEFYAHCLPVPKFKDYPSHVHLALNAQELFDDAMRFQETVLHGFALPCAGCILHTLSWRDWMINISLILCLLYIVLFPRCALAGIFIFAGIFMLLLKSERRRKAIVVNPSTASLDDEGYKMIAELGDPEILTSFLARVVTMMHGHVLDRETLQEFAASSLADVEHNRTYDNLKKQLRKAGEDPAPYGEPFVSFEKKPLKVGELVKWQGNVAEIVKCLNPNDPAGSRTYQVKVQHAAEAEEAQVQGDCLEVYPNVNWMSSKVVRAVIPDSAEDALMAVHPAMSRAGQQAMQINDELTALFSWESQKRSCMLTAVLLGAGFCLSWIGIGSSYGVIWAMILSWAIKAVIAFIIGLLLLARTSFFTRFMTNRRAKEATFKHSVKGFDEKWVFFQSDGEAGGHPDQTGSQPGQPQVHPDAGSSSLPPEAPRFTGERSLPLPGSN